MMQTTWRGTVREGADLQHALANNCECGRSTEGKILQPCPVHVMVATNQRAVNGLLFMRRMRMRLLMQEWQDTGVA